MVVALRYLKVGAELDPSKWEDGARRKIAADDAMAASDRRRATEAKKANDAVEQAANDTVKANDALAASYTRRDVRLSESNKALEQYKREMVGGYEEQRRMQTAVERTEKFLSTQKLTTDEAAKAMETLVKRYGQAAVQAEAASRGYTMTNGKLNEHAQALKAADDQWKRSAVSNDNLTKSTKLAAHEINNLTAQATDFAVQVGSGQGLFRPLLQQAPQAVGAVGGVGRAMSLLLSPMTQVVLGAAALAGGFALVAGRAVGIEGQIRSLTATTKAYGTEAQATAEQLRAMSKALYDGGAGKGEADAAAKVIASTRGLSAAMAKELSGIGNDMAAGLGQTVDATVKELATLATEGYPAIKKLQDEIGFLNADELKAVRTMAEHGQQAQALGIAMEALHRRFDGLRQQSMSPTEKALHDLGVGWNAFMDAVATSRPVMDTIANVSGAVVRMANAVSSTPKEQVADLETQAQEIRNSIAMRDTAKKNGETYIGITLWNLITGTTDGSDLENQLAKIEEKLKAARGRVVTELSKTPVRMAGTQAGANSYGGKTDEKALQYVDEQTAAYERLSKAMGGSAAQRALGLAAMKAEDEIRDKKLTGLDAENIRILRRNEAMLQMSTSYGDELRGLTMAAQGSVALADAYGVSEAAAIRQKAANDAVAATAGNAAVNVAELTRQNVMSVAAQSYEGIAKQNMELDLQNSLLPKVTASTKDGTAARMEAERQMQVQIALSPVLAAADAAEAEGNSILAAKLREAAAGYELKAKKSAEQQRSDGLEKLIDQQKTNIDQLKQQRSLIGASAQEQARANALYDAERQIKALGIDTTKQLSAEDAARVQTIRDQAVATADTTLEVQRQQDAYQTIADSLEKSFERVGDALVQVFVEGKGSAIDFGNIAKGILSSLMTDLVKMALVRPFSNAVFGTNYGTIFDVGTSAAANQNGSGGMAGNALSAGSKLIPNSWTSGITSSIDMWGYSALGVGTPLYGTAGLTSAAGGAAQAAGVAAVPGGVTNVAATPTVTGISGGTGLSSILGGGLAGAGAGMLVGGTLGTLTNSKAVGGLSGAASGAGVGFIVGGPVGAILGAIGGGLGGNFGRRPTGGRTVAANVNMQMENAA